MQDATSRKAKQQLGAAIRAGRQALSLSQEDFAERCDVHRTYIGAVERGEINVSLENILRISRALNVRPSVLFQRAEM